MRIWIRICGLLLDLYLEYKTYRHSFYEHILFDLKENSLGHTIPDTQSYFRQYLKSVLLQHFTVQIKQKMNSIKATKYKSRAAATMAPCWVPLLPLYSVDSIQRQARGF